MPLNSHPILRHHKLHYLSFLHIKYKHIIEVAGLYFNDYTINWISDRLYDKNDNIQQNLQLQ